ncbi:hypothetical protein NL676_017135 [Syzygium grande]|nr:hypothetical protein NL676_017135 [Syzygium grande]
MRPGGHWRGFNVQTHGPEKKKKAVETQGGMKMKQGAIVKGRTTTTETTEWNGMAGQPRDEIMVEVLESIIMVEVVESIISVPR